MAFDNSVFDENQRSRCPSHDLTSFLSCKKKMKPPAPLPIPSVFAKDAKLEQLSSGFSNASGVNRRRCRTIFFTNAASTKIYRLERNQQNRQR